MKKDKPLKPSKEDNIGMEQYLYTIPAIALALLQMLWGNRLG